MSCVAGASLTPVITKEVRWLMLICNGLIKYGTVVCSIVD